MDRELDEALSKKEKLRGFLTQGTDEVFGSDEIENLFKEVLND
jgi:flagellar biosynthesis/type III secretory pathway ATPase